jgi:hypothetical protein
MGTQIRLSDVRVESGKVIVGGEGGNALANGLVRKNATTIGELAGSFGYIDPTEISIGKDGSVIISNSALASKVNEMTQQKGSSAGGEPFFDNNCHCQGGNGE